MLGKHAGERGILPCSLGLCVCVRAGALADILDRCMDTNPIAVVGAPCQVLLAVQGSAVLSCVVRLVFVWSGLKIARCSGEYRPEMGEPSPKHPSTSACLWNTGCRECSCRSRGPLL